MTTIPTTETGEPGGLPTRFPRWLLLLSLCIAFVLMSIAYWRISMTEGRTSDHASILLIADEALRGNPLLRGYTMCTVNYYTTELPFYLAGVAALGMHPRLMHLVPGIVYALVVLAGVFLAGSAAPPGSVRYRRMALAFILIGLPTVSIAPHALVGPQHVAGYFLILLWLRGWDRFAVERLRASSFVGLTLLLTVTVFGDRFLLWIVILPAAAVALYRMFFAAPETARTDRMLLLSCVIAVVVSRALDSLVIALGGFETPGMRASFTTFEELPAHIWRTLDGLLRNFGAFFFGMPVGPGILAPLANLLPFGSVMFLYWRNLRQWWTRDRDGSLTAPTMDRVNALLTAVLTINLLAYAFSDIAVPGTWRYVTPFFLFSCVLAARTAPADLLENRRYERLRIGLAALYLLFFIGNLRHPYGPQPTDSLQEWLQARGLRYGYGSYWQSHIVTVKSRGAVTVRAVVAGPDGRLGPHLWMSKRDWYRGTPATFLVFDKQEFDRVSLLSGTKTFGPPTETHQVGDHTVLIWDRDITPLLAQP